jgi:hypothetical protein
MRCAAHGLFFIAGAAAMFAWNRAERLTTSSQDDADPYANRIPDSRTVGQFPDTKAAGQANQAEKKQASPDQAAEVSSDAPIADQPALAAQTPLAAHPADTHAVNSPLVVNRPSSISEADDDNLLRIAGVTEPAPGRYAKLPLATYQPVAFVDVHLGDRVEKGWQVFSHWESPERLQAMKTEVQRHRKLYEAAQTRLVSARQSAERLQRVQSSISRQRLEDAQTAVQLRQVEAEAAKLALSESESRFSAAEFEFSQAFVTSPISGVVTAVEVVAGERRRPGGEFRGVSVLDASVLHCRCLLTAEQLSRLQQSAGDAVADDATSDGATGDDATGDARRRQWYKRLSARVSVGGSTWPATIHAVGLQSEGSSGRIPVVLEISNPDETLSCGIAVDVVFTSHGITSSDI